MKKIGLGTRPSEIKERYKEIDFDETDIKEPSVKDWRTRKSVVKGRSRSSGSFWKITLMAITLLGVVVLLSSLLLFDLSFDIAVDHARFITGGKEIGIKDGGSFNVKFGDGLKLERVILKGFYRLFPPDDITVGVVGIPGSANLYDEDITPILKPEERLSYDILISKGSEELGKISFTLDMDAQDWIARGDAVEDRKLQAECYKKAVDLNPDSEEAHVALGRFYEGEKKVKSAISEYESAVRINPDNLSALKSLLSLYKKRKSRSKLINTYERLAKADVNGADKYYYRAGIIAERKNDPAKAMALYRKVLSGNRGNIDARQRLIKIYGKDKQWKRVAANTKVLLEYDPKNSELYLYLSDTYLKMNDIRHALSAAQEAEKFKSRDASIYLQLALLYEKAKKDDKAVEYYKKAVIRDSKNATAYNNLGLLLERKGKISEAIKNYGKAVALKPKDIGCYTNLADAYEKTRQWKKAVNVYKRVIKLDKKNKDAWEALAILYYKDKKKWKALEAYQQLSRLEPKKVLWHQKMAELYEQLGRLDKAREKYRIVLTLDPANKDAKLRYVEISKKKIKKKLK